MPRLTQDADFRTFNLPPGLLPLGYDQVISDDTFNDGYNGWQDHSERNGSTTSWNPPIGLSQQRTFNGSRHSLKLSTGTSTTANAAYGGSCSAYKRGARTHETGFLLLLQWIAYRGTAEQAAPRSIHMGIDTQKIDNSSRMFPKLVFQRWVGSGPDVFAPKYSIIDDSSKSVDIPGAAAASETSPTAGQGVVFGWNENKAGFFPQALVVSLDANGGVGAYHRALLGGKWFDLTGLSAGRGAQSPQLTTGGGGSSYAGGQNIGNSIFNRTATADGPAALFIGRSTLLHYPAGTEFPTS